MVKNKRRSHKRRSHKRRNNHYHGGVTPKHSIRGIAMLNSSRKSQIEGDIIRKKKIEAELKKEAEAVEAKLKKEAELQKKAEAELQKKMEAELQKKMEAELQKTKEAELQKTKDNMEFEHDLYRHVPEKFRDFLRSKNPGFQKGKLKSSKAIKASVARKAFLSSSKTKKRSR